MSGPPPDEGALEAGGSWLRRSWSNASPSLRIACVAMWGAGGAATVLGAIGDFAGWWESMPFLTNVASTVTGALFSVPLALVVFQGFAANETQKRDQRGVALLAKATVRDILHDITGLAPDATDLDQLADRLRKLDDELLPAAQDNRSQPLLAAAVGEWREVHELWSRTLVSQERAQRLLHDAATRWRFMREHVQPHMVRQQLGWISTEDTKEIGRLLTAASVSYWDPGELDDELVRAMEALLTADDLRPLSRYFSGSHYAIVAGIDEQVEQSQAAVASTTALIAAVRRLAAAHGWAEPG
ncbi:hypothetical protein GCM10022251_58590 [Phytohabitans flavus]|uniref:Uncharacterized protein n=1 Tax=Phytohabitans flavus TaxID=1076124 RepID=A0A6F8XXC5_9ACTN|nr:hypothetical protein [Phytohabitans flavus]BCB78512.1 hypothetical protein Pflav_049220 [Phytohabitans flavus]